MEENKSLIAIQLNALTKKNISKKGWSETPAKQVWDELIEYLFGVARGEDGDKPQFVAEFKYGHPYRYLFRNQKDREYLVKRLEFEGFQVTKIDTAKTSKYHYYKISWENPSSLRDKKLN